MPAKNKNQHSNSCQNIAGAARSYNAIFIIGMLEIL
jgi:hypothetical protein